MPELPEVETIRRGLHANIVGKTIESIEVRVPKLFRSPHSDTGSERGDRSGLVGLRIKKIGRLGKMLIIDLSNGEKLAIHLKMTGQLIFLEKMANLKSQTLNSKQTSNSKLQTQNDAFRVSNLEFRTSTQGVVGGHPDGKYNQPLPHKYTHITFKFTDGSTLYYNDLRKFGWMAVIDQRLKSKDHSRPELESREILNSKFKDLISKFGVDGLSRELTAKYLTKKLSRRKNITIKQALLDQSVIAGIGNIYADEILYSARILPTRKVASLSNLEIGRIVGWTPKILNRSLEVGGTSSSDYVRLDGSQGSYQKIAFVYGREGEPCRRCQTPIKRIKIGGRSSHYCSKCQK